MAPRVPSSTLERDLAETTRLYFKKRKQKALYSRPHDRSTL